MSSSEGLAMNHLKFMREAIKEAKKGLKEGGIPIGSVLVIENKIVGRGRNRKVQKNSTILHAEMDCLENAGKLSARDYKKATLYSTLSPCPMCTGAILWYEIPTVVIGENTTAKGPENYSKRKGVKIINLDLEECKELMKNFINKHPKLWEK